MERMEKNKIEDILRTKGRIVTTAEGNSMLPCIRPQKDVLILEKPDEIFPLEVILFSEKKRCLCSASRIGSEAKGIYFVWRFPIPERAWH